jgi:hypothetical protein
MGGEAIRFGFAMRKLLICLSLLAVLVQSAEAVETNRKKETLPTNEIGMPFLVAPVSKEGTLIGFQYISSKMITFSSQSSALVRTKLAFIQDAYVRDVYHTPVSSENDPTQVDRAALHDRLMVIAQRIVGGGNVKDIVFLDVKFAPLHPKPGGSVFSPSPGAGNRPAGQENGGNPGTAAPANPATTAPQKDGKP